MRKVTLILSFRFLTVLLVGCSKNKVKIKQKDFTGNTYEYIVTYNKKDLELNELKSLAYNTAFEIYETIKEDIGTDKVYISILVKSKQVEKLTLMYVVNQNYENPGLKLLKETIK